MALTRSAAVTFRKTHSGAPLGLFAWEAAGLRWLAAAGAARVVEVQDVGDDHLDLVRLRSATPTTTAARRFGQDLAGTHDAGASAFGVGPDGWSGDGYFGPLGDPLPLRTGTWDSWGAFYAEARLAPMVRLCRDSGVYDADTVGDLERLADRVGAGRFDTDDAPARLHGDLWSGNVIWTADGAVLIDPAAHGGHRENDLALLALFGCPHLEEVRGGYQEVHPLASGWAERVELHQLHCLLVHAVLFGGGYGGQALAAARRCL